MCGCHSLYLRWFRRAIRTVTREERETKRGQINIFGGWRSVRGSHGGQF